MTFDPPTNSAPTLEMDPARFEVYLRGRLIGLSPKAFDVLRLLAENRERVVEKDEIFTALWGEAFVTDNALTRVVKEIRSQIGDDAADPIYIATIPRRGYRFIGPVVFKTGRDQATSAEKPFAPQPARHGSSRTRKVVGMSVAAVLLLTLGFAIYVSRSATTEITSIAVIPLDNATGDADLSYLSDGLTETLINDLSSIPTLRVVPRTSSFGYRASFRDVRTAGRDLGVQAVVSGRIAKQADEIVVQVELSITDSGAQIWGSRFARKADDLVQLESEISKEVASRISSRLEPGATRRVGRTYTDNAAAHEAYLRGRHHLNKVSPTAVRTAIGYFQNAVDIDPTYAPAFVGLADSNRTLALNMEGSAAEYFPRSKAAASRALEIDPDLAEAHAALGFATMFYDRDWQAAERHLKRSIQLNPNSSEARAAYSAVFTVSGRFDEAVRELAHARELDPLNLRVNSLEGLLLITAGRTDDGLSRLESTKELDPKFFLPYMFAASGYIDKERLEVALEQAERARELSGGHLETLALVGYLKARLGDVKGASTLLNELEHLRANRYVPPFCLALVHNGLGQPDKAIAWLEVGLSEKDAKLLFLPGDPRWRNLESDPRYSDLLTRVGFAMIR